MRGLRQWWPALCWAAVIWAFSAAHFSSAATSRVIEPLLRWLFSSVSPRTIRYIHHLIRKAAHVTEYFVFSLMLFRAFRGKERGWRVTWMVEAIVVAAFYASLDEMHQAFVPAPDARWPDSMLDTLAAPIRQLPLCVCVHHQSHR